MLDEKELKKIISDSMPKQGNEEEQLDEAYVASPKTYMQTSELVSQKTKDTHIKLYHHEIARLNKVSAELDAADRVDVSSDGCEYRSLKIDETRNLNAVYLHELYFANCFDPHSELFFDTLAYMRLQRDWGTFEMWQADFMACAQSCGQGWAVCGYNTFLKRFVNMFVSNHSQDVMMGLIPVIVVDMFEHARFKDYLDDKKSYLIAQMKEFNWEIIEERFKKIEKVNEALK